MFNSKTIKISNIIIQYVQSNPMSSNIRVLIEIYYICIILYFGQIISIINIINPLATERGGDGVGDGPLNPSRSVSIVFSYWLNFFREWHLCKFLILEDLSPHLFGLILPCPTSKRGLSESTGTSFSSIKVGSFKTLLFKKQLKKVAQALFIYVCV